MKKLITTIYILGCLTYSFTSHAQTVPNEVIQGPFKTDLYPDGKIYFEKENDATNNDPCQTIAFILEYKQDNHIKKEQIDEYSEDGACVELASVFFAKVHNKSYIFVMQKWGHNMPSVDISNDFYTTTAYTKDQDGSLIIDSKMFNDPNLSGTDGYVDDGVRHRLYYKYKTAAAIKKYLKQKYQ